MTDHCIVFTTGGITCCLHHVYEVWEERMFIEAGRPWTAVGRDLRVINERGAATAIGADIGAAEEQKAG